MPPKGSQKREKFPDVIQVVKYSHNDHLHMLRGIRDGEYTTDELLGIADRARIVAKQHQRLRKIARQAAEGRIRPGDIPTDTEMADACDEIRKRVEGLKHIREIDRNWASSSLAGIQSLLREKKA